MFDLVVVPDGDLDAAVERLTDTLPDGKQLQTFDINDFIK